MVSHRLTSTDNTWNGDYLLNNNERISGGFNGGFALDWHHQGALAANNMFCPFYNSGAVAPQEFASSTGCPESSPDNSALKAAQNAALNLAQYDEFITQNRYADDASAFSILLNDSNMRDSLTNLYGYIDNWYNYLSTANIGKFEEIQKLLASNNRQAAINKANTLITSSVIYQNLKTLSLLFANNLISTDSIPTDSSVVYVLNTIADQDPTIGGKAVWIARAILKKDIFAFSNNLNRVKNEIKVNSAIETADVSIKPNPANKEITVSSNSIIKEIVIEDMQGMRVKQLQLTENANSIEINISNLTSGVYVVKCHFENEKYLFTKLVITK
ncbi:MAG: T9SS type A sorting domain-containing protein [Bacteroidetes bacterium]|nr:T9SS type A sorting domain-containing protein [Bacteroidota bacterium]